MNHMPSSPSLKRKRQTYFPVLLTLLDLSAIIAGLLAAYWLRFQSNLMAVTKGYIPHDYFRLLPLAAVVWLVAFSFVHLYRRNEKVWSWRVAGRILKGSLLAVGLFVSVLFFARGLTQNPTARGMIPLSLCTVMVIAAIERMTVHLHVLSVAKRSGRGFARALVIGVGPSAEQIVHSVRRHPEFGWTLVGYLAADESDLGKTYADLEVIGVIKDLPSTLSQEHIEAVFVAQPDFRHEALGNILIECQKRMVDVKVVPDATEMLFSQVTVEEVDGIPFLGLRETPLQGWNVVLKRTFDLLLASITLALVSPLFLLIAWLVKRDSEGPVFYKQERVGADGRHFRIIKFRTMWADAEKMTGPVFAAPDDPRQTPLGRVLRQLHLDEIPQLLNVFSGDMSMVGPRPERPHFVDLFREEVPGYMARHRIKSGMTGWAQVNGQTGFEGSISDRLKYDLYYIENWSILFDLKVLALTFVWLGRRAKQMKTLPANHPSLRKAHDLDLALSPVQVPQGLQRARKSPSSSAADVSSSGG